MHPYTTDISLCEELIFYCSKAYRQSQNDKNGTTDTLVEDDSGVKQKKIDEMISKNKMQAFERVDESALNEKQKKGRKRREGPGVVYEDDGNLQLEFPLIQVR